MNIVVNMVHITQLLCLHIIANKCALQYFLIMFHCTAECLHGVDLSMQLIIKEIKGSKINLVNSV